MYVFFTSPAFDVALPCFLEEGVLVNITLMWSQFQPNGQLILRSYDLQFYRSCIITNDTSTDINKVVITGVCILYYNY